MGLTSWRCVGCYRVSLIPLIYLLQSVYWNTTESQSRATIGYSAFNRPMTIVCFSADADAGRIATTRSNKRGSEMKKNEMKRRTWSCNSLVNWYSWPCNAIMLLCNRKFPSFSLSFLLLVILLCAFFRRNRFVSDVTHPPQTNQIANCYRRVL